MGVFQKLQTVFKSNRKLDIHQRFELLKEAVSGTMSNFYMARDRENDRIVGLKVGLREKGDFFERTMEEWSQVLSRFGDF